MSSGYGMEHVGKNSQLTAERERMQEQEVVDKRSNPAVAAEADHEKQQARQRKQQPEAPESLAAWLVDSESRPSGVCLVIA